MDVLCEKPVATPPCHVTTINDLPNVIMEDILVRLPTESCFQCRGVSKLWRALVSSAHFAHRFLYYPIDQFHIEDDLFLIEGNTPLCQLNSTCFEEFKTLPFSFKFFLHYNKRITILASCGDFLLCSASEHLGSSFDYYIGNPLNQRWVQLPPFRGAWKNHLVGFVCNKKRLVVVHLTAEPAISCVWKLSSETDTWTSIRMSYSLPNIFKTVEFNVYLIYHNRHFVAHNGRLYLLAEKGVLEYDPISDLWSFFGYSFKTVEHYDSFSIRSCGGVLRLSQLNAISQYSYFRIWQLKEDCNEGKREWCLKRNVKFNKIYRNVENSWRTVLNFHLSDGEKVYSEWINSFTALCNLKEKTVQLLGKTQADFSIGFFSTWAPILYSYKPRASQIWQ